MPRVTFVKAARKANPRYGIAVGDSYYHWAFMQGGRGGPKICSKIKPTRQQLTRSEFLQALYTIEDSLEAAEDADAMRAVAEEVRTLGEEQSEKFENMPEGLQQGDTGQLLEERRDNCESWADEIESAADELETKVSEISDAEEKRDAKPEHTEPQECGQCEGTVCDGTGELPDDDEEEDDEDRDFDQERADALIEALEACPSPF